MFIKKKILWEKLDIKKKKIIYYNRINECFLYFY